MIKRVISALIILVLAVGLGYFVFKSEPRLNKNFENTASFFKNHPFVLGLDLSGGSHLVYEADVSALDEAQVGDSMEALRDVIERRVNAFGVAEPVVQVQTSGFVSGGENKLIVDLPGVTDVDKANQMIGQTPRLEFKVELPKAPQEVKVNADGTAVLDAGSFETQYTNTELTGRYLKRANLEFNSTTREPIVGLQFDDKGTELFAQITRENVGKSVAIYLDGFLISAPRVNEEIPNGQAVISGNFKLADAKTLVGRLNSGALPVPINLVSKQTIGAILGESAINAGVRAAMFGFLLVALFLIIWYRLPGLIATVSLLIFITIMLFLFKLIPVTLTAAGIAGFIISMGVAVDANVLIFERIKEELRLGRTIMDSVSAGFDRAWLSIRDSNTSTIISSVILFWFGTSLIKGFALTLGMGILVSMLSAIVVTRVFLRVVSVAGEGKVARFLFSSGLNK